MADAVPHTAPATTPTGDGAAARTDSDKTTRRTRGGRGGGGKNRATAGTGDAAVAENVGASNQKQHPHKGGKPRAPRGDTRAAAAAGEATGEAATGPDAKPAKHEQQQQRERKPRDRKPKATSAGAEGESGVTTKTAPPRAPVSATRESKPVKKQQPKAENKKSEAKQPEAAADVAVRDEKETNKKSSGDHEKKKSKTNPKTANKTEADGDEADSEEKEEEEEEVVVDWSTAAWFSGCDADLGTGYWLLTRSYASNDLAVLASEALARRAVLLQKLHARLKTELLPQDEPEEAEAEEAEDETRVAKPKTKEWTPAEIVDAVVAGFPETDDESTGEVEKKAPVSSAVVSLLEGEVVDVATELLIGRVGCDNLELLMRWEAHLASLLPEATPAKAKTARTEKMPTENAMTDAAGAVLSKAEKAPNARNDAGDADVIDGTADGAHSVVPPDDIVAATTTATTEPSAIVLPPPRQRKRRGAGGANSAIAHAKAQVTAAIAFHRTYARQAHDAAADTTSVDDGSASAAAAQWTQEITTIFEATRVNAADEARRKGVAAQIESAFRRSPNWRHHEVLLFGSSLSKFGSKTSDLDLCLRATNVDPEETSAIMSVRELKLRMRRTQQQQDGSVPAVDGVSRNDDAPFLKELLGKSLKTVAALANTVTKQRKKTANKSDAKIQKLALLLAHWNAIVVALEFFHDKLTSGGSHVSASASTQREAKAAAAAYHAAMHKQQKKRQKDIYAASALLTRNGCDVDLVVAHARVPVIGFTHKASGFECDLCFENYHACINTLLLRTYAECDDRARMLGMAVKHWAKRRGINDASLGFLSSYSFILLVIYFFQHKARLLPNLQDPALLREAKVEPMKLNGVDVSFCGAVARAKTFHVAQLEKQPPTAPHDAASVGTLLLSFFRFYVEEFDFSQHVVSVRHPEKPMNKSSRWGRNKLKTWRFSIEDPLELDRDLGSVLQFRCQQRIVAEMKRALTLLRDGQSFETAVCEADANAKTNENATKAAKKKAKTEPQTKRAGAGAQGGKKETPRDRKDRNGKKVTPADDGTKQATAPVKEGSRDAPPNGDKKPPSSRERRPDRHPAREKLVPANDSAPTAASNNPQGERPSRGRTENEKGGRRGPRGDDDKPKDAATSTSKPTEA